MAQRFNLTAQLQLQANSSNIAQVVSQLKKQLAPIGNVQINVQANTKSLVQANQQMATFSQNAKNANGSMGDFNRSLAESARRFSVITVATGSLLSLVNAFKKSTRAAIDFEYEMVKISQTTGQTMREVGAMSDEIRKLSTSLGVSSAELAGTARILLQAGLSADKTRKSLDILAKTTLSASFDDIQSTTEGAIALINQFRNEAARAGGDVKFLEKSLDSINAVSKAFAVESADLVDVIRKVGGVFSNAGGSVNELISLFTSVRATTRESAETIGTGLRTIFTRIQRGDTVDALKELGIELRNSQGQFVGAFEAVKRLSEGLSSLDPRDFRFAAVVEELGGYRQIGKVIPLINQFAVAQQALNIAQNASGSVAADAQTSQQALAVQINKTKEKFNEFIASLTGSESFRSIITGALKLADAFINIGKALEPVLPLLTTLFALKAGQGLASGIGILRGFAGAPSGIRASKFASGGLVPGSGNRDTVPAMLTPGEFVIRKSSVNKLGAATLAQMNANGYAEGGLVVNRLQSDKFAGLFAKPKGQDSSGKLIAIPPKQGREGDNVLATIGAPKSFFIGGADEQAFTGKAESLLAEGINQLVSSLAPKSKNKVNANILSDIGAADIAGKIFEGVTRTAIGDFSVGSGSQQGFDIPSGKDASIYTELGNLFNAGQPMIPDVNYDNKLTENRDSRQSLLNKAANAKLFDQPINITTFSGPGKALSTAQIVAQRITPENKKIAQTRVDELQLAKQKLESLAIDEETSKIVESRLQADRVRLVKYINSKTKVQKKAFGGLVQKFNKGSSGTGVKPSNYPLVDDILENARGAILPNPKNIEDIIKAGGGALDVDRTLIRTIGDKAYAQAKTEKAKEEVLKKYFVGAGRLQDIKSSPLTQFGKTLQSAIQNGQINPNNLKIITKSRRVDGVGEYLNQLFGIPLANMIFTQGGSKQPALDAFNTKGSRAQRVVKRASGGGISGSDTVPAMLTPGEFVVSKSAAQSIGYTNLNRMNKHGVQGYARGGVVGVQKFAQGGVAQQLDQLRGGTGAVSQLSIKEFAMLKQAAIKNTSAFEQLTGQLSGLTDVEAVKAALKGFTRNVDKVSDDTELVSKSMQSANKAIGRTEDANEQLARRLEQQQASDARKTAGTSEARAAGSIGVGSVKGDTIVKLQNYFDKMGLSVDQTTKAISAYVASVQNGKSKQDARSAALQLALKSTYTDATASETLAQAKQTLAQKLKSNIVQNAKNAGQGLGTKEGRQAFGQQINAVSGAAQNFVFLGASIAAVAGQFSSLGAATQQAITETAGFTSGLVGIGATLIQTFTSMATNSALAATTQMSNTATQQIDTTTTQAHASAVAEDTLQTKGAGAAAAGIANMFAIAAGAVVAVIAGLKFMSSRSKAQADVIEKERKARLANIAETGKSDLPIADLKKSLNEELALREWSASAMSTSTMVASGSIALAGAAGGAAIGAALGSSVPVLGTAIGAVVGVIGGLTYAYFNAEAAVNNEIAARQKEVDAITKVYEAHIQLAETSYKANAALSAVESAPGLQGPEKIKRRLEAQAIGSGIGLQTARKVRPQISQDAASLGITEAQLKALTPDEIRTKGATVEGLGQKQIEGIAARAQVSFETLKMAADQAAAEVQETGKTLNDAIQNLNFSETNAGFESVRLFAEATNAARRAIEIEQQIRLEGAKTKEEEDLVIQQTNNRLSAFDAGIKATESAKRAEEVAIKRAVAAQVAMAEAARKSAIFLNSLGDQEDQIQSQSNALKNFTDSLAGNIVDISNSIKPIRNIEDPSKVTDRSRFAREVQAAANASGNPEAAKFANQLTNAADIFARANDTLLGKTLDLGESLNANKVLKDIGLTAETFGGGAAGKKIFDNIAAELTKAAQENPVLTEEALKNILGPLSEQASTAADVINKIQSIQQQELNFRQQQLQAEQAVRDKELQAIDKYNAAVLSGVEVMARARGKSVAEARFSAEQQARQRKLNKLQDRRGGTFLDAADPVQLTQAKKTAEEREALVRKEINGLQASTELKADDLKRISELQAIQLKLKFTTQDAVEALEGLANSSAKIDMLTESLDKERAAREQAFSVLKEFVVGGAESRESLKMASQGVLSAIRTGTTQNLPEELRGQVFGLLDKLSNVEIAGTGLTGDQIAKELVARDAIRLGFPPDIAIALATQTTTEEKILKELKAQTILMANTARAAAEPPATLSNGGPVYRAAGGSIFKPRGTDTVPAMLTPGEFVINAKSTRENLPLLQAINNGSNVTATGYRSGGKVVGGVSYLADGGFGVSWSTDYAQQKTQLQKDFEPYIDDVMKYRKTLGITKEAQGIPRSAWWRKGKYPISDKGLAYKFLGQYADLTSPITDDTDLNFRKIAARSEIAAYKQFETYPDTLKNWEKILYQTFNGFVDKAANSVKNFPDSKKAVDAIEKMVQQNFAPEIYSQSLINSKLAIPEYYGSSSWYETLISQLRGQFGLAVDIARQNAGLKSFEESKIEEKKSTAKEGLQKRFMEGVQGSTGAVAQGVSVGVSSIGNLVNQGVELGQTSGLFDAATKAEEKEKSKKAAEAKRNTKRNELAAERRRSRDEFKQLKQNRGLNRANAITQNQQQNAAGIQAPAEQAANAQVQQQAAQVQQQAAQQPAAVQAQQVDPVRQQQEAIMQQQQFNQQRMFGVPGKDGGVLPSIQFTNKNANRTLNRFNRKLQMYRQRGRPDWEAYYDFFGYVPNNLGEAILSIPGYNFGAGASYYNSGGHVSGPSGIDKVPAMLTAGEFVMNKQAVQQHGVGYMQSLNRGSNVKKFNKGGLVGGGVNYLQNGGQPTGGGLSFNFGGIQSIFDSFSGDFKGGLDNIITAFSSFGGIVGSLVSALSAGMNVVHQFSGDMTLAFNIQNGDVLKNQIAEAITPKLKEIITRELDARLDNINFKAGGS